MSTRPRSDVALDVENRRLHDGRTTPYWTSDDDVETTSLGVDKSPAPRRHNSRSVGYIHDVALTSGRRRISWRVGKGCCLILKQNAAVTNGHFSMMARLRTRLNTMEYLEKENIDFIEPDISAISKVEKRL